MAAAMASRHRVEGRCSRGQASGDQALGPPDWSGGYPAAEDQPRPKPVACGQLSEVPLNSRRQRLA